VMVDQPERLDRDELFKLVFGRSGARHITRTGFGGNMVPPVPAQGVIVDVKFTSGSLDRGTGPQAALDPHALGVITALASASRCPLSSCHLCPKNYTSKSKFLKNHPFQDPHH